MNQISIAVLLLSIISFAVGFVTGVIVGSDDKYHTPATNFDRYVQVNREELIKELANKYCINPFTYKHEQMECEHCPFEDKDTHMVEYCAGNTEEWLKRPYID